MFAPIDLNQRLPRLGADVQAWLSRSETALVRLEDRAEGCEVRGALHRVLSRLEAVSSVRVEGRRPRLSTVLKIESLLSFDGTDSADRVAALDALDFDDEEDREAAIEAVYYQMALGMIYGSMGPGTPFTSQTMLDIHSMLRFGRLASESGTKVRTREYHPRTHDDGTPLHVPPTPAEAPALLDELCAFVGSDLYSPIGQAAVAHFQLEEIKPFKTGLDRTGRLLSHAIIYRRGLSRGLVAPIGLAPAIDTDRHARSLLPYRFEDTQGRVDVEEAVGRWARFCAESVLVCCQAADVYLGEILSLRDAWLERFGKPNKGSAVGALLGLMPGQPVLTVRQAALLLGRSISSTNEALLRLEDAGIVASEDGFGRNRIYRAVEAEALLESLENRFIPNCPVARDTFGG